MSKFNLCSACQNLQPRILTATDNIPRSCLCPKLEEYFGGAHKGFPSGIDVIHCDYFQQYPIMSGDFLLTDDGIHGCSYILTAPREILKTHIPKLYDNSKNIKKIYI